MLLNLIMLILKHLLKKLCPQSCVVCQQPAHQALCCTCRDSLPWLNCACPRCGKPMVNKTALTCGACLKNPPPFSRAFHLFSYEPPISDWITRYKYHRQLYFAALCAQLLANKLQEAYKTTQKPDVIIPVPLHAQRMRTRGFNQSLLLARLTAGYLNMPLFTLTRHKHTVMQKGLLARARERNVKDAFAIEKTMQHSSCIIIDDVMTTGTTLREVTKTLQKAGMQDIHVACIAKTTRVGVQNTKV